MRYLITGSKWQLGKEFVNRLNSANEEYLAVDADEMDVTVQEEVMNIICGYKPDVVIHGAAYTNVDSAETDIKTAYRVNAVGTQNVAAACLACSAKMVYVSTDYVFDGKTDKAYSEVDVPNPQSVYGKSKLAGELIAGQIVNRLFIIRTAWLYGEGTNFIRTMLRLGEEKREIRVVNDQYGAPTSTVDLAKAILAIVQTESYGTYHAANKGLTTWYDLAKTIFAIAGNDQVSVLPQTTEELNRPACRPAFSKLDCTMLELVVGENIMRPWQDALLEYVNREILRK